MSGKLYHMGFPRSRRALHVGRRQRRSRLADQCRFRAGADWHRAPALYASDPIGVDLDQRASNHSASPGGSNGVRNATGCCAAERVGSSIRDGMTKGKVLPLGRSAPVQMPSACTETSRPVGYGNPAVVLHVGFGPPQQVSGLANLLADVGGFHRSSRTPSCPRAPSSRLMRVVRPVHSSGGVRPGPVCARPQDVHGGRRNEHAQERALSRSTTSSAARISRDSSSVNARYGSAMRPLPKPSMADAHLRPRR